MAVVSSALTAEQDAAVARVRGGGPTRVVARAGTGKTATLVAMAEATAPRPALYLAFNRSIAEEARARFPAHVRVATLHGLAYRAVVARNAAYRRKFEAGHGRLDTLTLRRVAGLQPGFEGRAARHAAHVRATVAGFCASADARPDVHHVPASVRTALARELPPERLRDRLRWLARRAARLWHAMADPADPCPLPFDAFLKLYGQQGPRWPEASVWVDEAQDLNPVMLSLLRHQEAQRVLVGDPHQQIYAWRGAVDALAAFPFPLLSLTRSFRFGPRIAAVARRVLAALEPRPRLTGAGGADQVTCEPLPEGSPRTILCRTHAGLVDAALAFAEQGLHVVGGVRATTDTLRAVHALRAGRASAHPALEGARGWDDFVRLADEAPGPARTLRSLAERYGTRLPAVCRALERAHVRDETRAAVVLSTVHKAKGRQWPTVELWGDVPRVPTSARALAAAPDPDAARAEANLLYVAVTRAQRMLGLARAPEDVAAWLTPDEGAGPPP